MYTPSLVTWLAEAEDMYKVLDVDVNVDVEEVDVAPSENLEVWRAIPNAAVLELLLRTIVNGRRNKFLEIMICY